MNSVVKNDRRRSIDQKSRTISCSVSAVRRPVNVRIPYCLLLVCIVVSIFGCRRSVQKTTDWPSAVSVADFVPEATQIVRQGLDDEDPRIRVHAIEVVATTKQIKLMPRVQRLLKDQFVRVRFAAALAVGDLEYHLAERELAELLNTDNDNVRIAAAYAMGKLGSADSFEVLRKALTGSDQTVRANAALLLGKSGDKRALMFLYIAMRQEDSDDKVRFQAAESIAMLGDDRIMPKLWATVFSAYADVRVVGVRAMGALGTEKAREVLITKLDDDVLEVRLAAAEQLGMLGETAAEPVVLDVFRRNLTARMRGEELERIRVLTALAIGRIGTPYLARYLPRMLKDESKSVRIAAAKAVFQCAMKSRPVEKSGI